MRKKLVKPIEIIPPVWLQKIKKRFSVRVQLIGGWLQKKVAAIPPGRMKVYFILFIMLLNGFYVWAIIDAVHHRSTGIYDRWWYSKGLATPAIHQPLPKIERKREWLNRLKQ
jgi:hypothetical protein